jgi:hypothetical protein
MGRYTYTHTYMHTHTHTHTHTCTHTQTCTHTHTHTHTHTYTHTHTHTHTNTHTHTIATLRGPHYPSSLQITTAGTTDYEDGGSLSESIESIRGGAEGEEEDEMF